jgi:hypothetical protein
MPSQDLLYLIIQQQSMFNPLSSSFLLLLLFYKYWLQDNYCTKKEHNDNLI